MRKFKMVAFGAAILLAGALPTLVQASTADRPLSVAEQSKWGAIGQLTYGGKSEVGKVGVSEPGAAICTGTLVAADLVLTAGHCVAVNGVPMKAGDIQFAAGWRDGVSFAVRHGRGIVVAQPTAGQPRQMSQDVALLLLDAPIGPEIVRPLPLSRQDLFAESYSFIGYRRDAPAFAQYSDICNLTGIEPGILRLSCPVVSGNSGAPVLKWRHGAWQVAAVMVARGSDTLSYAVIPGDDLRAVIAGR